MMNRREDRSFWHVLVFWWAVLVLLQFGERLFLFSGMAMVELPSVATGAQIFGIGFLGDAITATGLLVVALVMAVPLAVSFAVRQGARRSALWCRSVAATAGIVGVLLAGLLIIDVGYFTYNRQHLDFVFFEYLDELVQGGGDTGTSQAAQQTGAELAEAGKWVVRIGSFFLLEFLLVAGWWAFYARCVAPALGQWRSRRPVAAPVMLSATLIGSVMGLSPAEGTMNGSSFDREAYHSLAQNPVLFAREPLQDALLSQWTWSPRRDARVMTIDDAIRTTQAALNGRFPVPGYPLVREMPAASSRSFSKPANIVLLFVEGLDRRYLGRAVTVHQDGRAASGAVTRTVPLTPFLTRLQEDSLYVANFFSNGVQTARGLFSTFCSASPRHGTAAIKTRQDRNYLCLPAVLKQYGFETEMVVGLESDLTGLRTFAARNGIDRLYGDSDFGSAAQRLGVGVTDRDLLRFMTARLESLQGGSRPFLLAAMTAGTHHPFRVPDDHPDVRALQQDADAYPAALRSFDLELERFFARGLASGLLKDTVVVILGDHGRHEPVGRTDLERQVGHFMAPLFIWIDASLRGDITYRPRSVFQVVSQVDLAPTILSLNRLTPDLAPFVGRDVSCLLAEVCVEDNRAYLTSVYDDLIGWADPTGLWLYSFRRHVLSRVALGLDGSIRQLSVSDDEAAQARRTMFAFYTTSNVLLEQNRLWPAAPLHRPSS